MLTFASIETGLVFFANMTLQNGLEETARLIRTGQAQNQNMTQTQFRQALCDQVKFLLSCDPTDLVIDVRAFTSFGAANYPQAIDANGNLNPNLNAYQTGGSSQITGAQDIILIRTFYEWPLFTPMFSQYYSNLANGKRLISSSAAFRNEPF
jgi:Flp pilus assembly protein TadG